LGIRISIEKYSLFLKFNVVQGILMYVFFILSLGLVRIVECKYIVEKYRLFFRAGFYALLGDVYKLDGIERRRERRIMCVYIIVGMSDKL